MKKNRKYRITIDDESRLRDIVSFSMQPWKWVVTIILWLIVSLLFAGMLIYITPLRQLLPGYMKRGERAATEVGMLRLDSLSEAYQRNEAYLANIMTVLDTDRTPAAPPASPATGSMLATDSLTEASETERRFVAEVREREKYNISVVAPLAADAMMFVPVSPESIITTDSRGSHTAHVVMAQGESPAAVADGRVVGIFSSPATHGNVMIIQHAKGFLSSYSHLGTLLAEVGDEVTGGQIIAFASKDSGLNGSDIYLRMWHNGTPLIPYEYVGKPFKWHHDATDDKPER